MIAFTHGMATMGFAVAGLFFLRFWRRTNDVFFIFFAAAFWLFAINNGIVALLDFNDFAGIAYVLRLVGFGLIIAGIFSKNRASTPID